MSKAEAPRPEITVHDVIREASKNKKHIPTTYEEVFALLSAILSQQQSSFEIFDMRYHDFPYGGRLEHRTLFGTRTTGFMVYEISLGSKHTLYFERASSRSIAETDILE